ncbi:MAG: amidohydrolase family protein [Armatimonadota bacterium]|nr:amidohydrolase family protein [Armatimonadota bacterium]
MIDCHVHLRKLGGEEKLESIRNYIGANRMNIVCTFSREKVNTNYSAFVAKTKFPNSFYIFPALDHAAYFSDERLSTPSLAEQVDRLVAIGVDGIKMLENKPTHRKLVNKPIDGEYFHNYFARVEQLGIPILWHVADPEEFWNPELTPEWAKKQGWGYDETFVPKEQLYSEVENVLRRNPRLKIIFAHFYFLSADLPRLSSLFERFEGVHVDLAPGIELLYNLSKNPETTREFFIRYSDRILFGTDISDYETLEENRIRAGIVKRWLETNDLYRVPEGADFLLGPPEDGIMRGLELPANVLEKIYHLNFERLAGPKPRPLDCNLAAEECKRLANEISFINGVSPEQTEANRAAGILELQM